MNKPPLEVADVIRAAGKGFIERQRAWVTGLHRKVLYAIEHCHTAALGGTAIVVAHAAISSASPATAAAIGIARAVSAMPAGSGCPPVSCTQLAKQDDSIPITPRVRRMHQRLPSSRSIESAPDQILPTIRAVAAGALPIES